MSVLINEAYANETTPLWASVGGTATALPFGKFLVTGGTKIQNITCLGMTATGLVSVCYLHTNNGGENQYIENIVPDIDFFSVILGKNGASTPLQEYIIWQVLQLS